MDKMNLQTDTGRWNAIETFGVICPNCGMNLYRPKAISKITGEKMAGACPNCGYKQPLTTPKRTTPDMARRARMNRSIGFYQGQSVFPNDSFLTMNFKSYVARTSPQAQFKNFMFSLANRMSRGDTVHSIVAGTSGVGKTHLANAVLQSIQEKTDYRFLCLFIDWSEYLRRLKEAMSSPDVNAKNRDLMTAVKKANVVVIDDLGSERGSEYDISAAGDMFRILEDKSLIVTTNLFGQALENRYGARIISRIGKHSQGSYFGVEGISDYRTS